MGKKSPSPSKVARQQAAANAEAVRESARVGQIGTQTPFGRTFFTGEIGEPGRTQVTELTPEGQRAVSAQQQLAAQLAEFGAGELGGQVIGRLGQGAGGVEDALFQRGAERIASQFDPAEEQLRSRLLSQGLSPGSRAFEGAMSQFGQQRTDALENLALSSQIQAGAEDRAQRSQAINELSALLQGAPAISGPQPFQGPQFQVAAPDITGLTAAESAGRAQGLGGLFGALGTLGGAALGGGFF